MRENMTGRLDLSEKLNIVTSLSLSLLWFCISSSFLKRSQVKKKVKC